MGGKQSVAAGGNVPTGTKWSEIVKDRKKYGDVEIPDIPFNKLKEVTAEIDMTVKQSEYLKEYKKEVRDALKRKKQKGHEPRLMRLYDKSLHPADAAVGKDEDRKAMIKMLVENITPVVKDDIIDGFKEDGVQGDEASYSKEADKIIFKLIHERVHDKLHDTTERIFKRYQRGEDPEVSDPEDDEEAEARREEERAERARVAAEQRQAEAAAWQAELNGEEPPAPAPAPAADDSDDDE